MLLNDVECKNLFFSSNFVWGTHHDEERYARTFEVAVHRTIEI